MTKTTGDHARRQRRAQKNIQLGNKSVDSRRGKRAGLGSATGNGHQNEERVGIVSPDAYPWNLHPADFCPTWLETERMGAVLGDGHRRNSDVGCSATHIMKLATKDV